MEMLSRRDNPEWALQGRLCSGIPRGDNVLQGNTEEMGDACQPDGAGRLLAEEYCRIPTLGLPLVDIHARRRRCGDLKTGRGLVGRVTRPAWSIEPPSQSRQPVFFETGCPGFYTYNVAFQGIWLLKRPSRMKLVSPGTPE